MLAPLTFGTELKNKIKRILKATQLKITGVFFI